MEIFEKCKSNLITANKLVNNIDGLVGKEKRVKCILDSDGNYQLTRNGLNYLKAIEFKNFVYYTIYENCYKFNEIFGYGSEEYLLYVGYWCKCFLNLLEMDLPLDVIKHLTSEILERSIQELMQSYTKKLQKITDIEEIINTKEVDASKNLSTKTRQQNTLYKNNMKFLKYSRHAMNELNEDSLTSKERDEELLTQLLKLTCQISDLDLAIQLCQLLIIIYKDRKKSSNDDFLRIFSQLDFNSSILIEPIHFMPITESKIFQGLLIPHYEFDNVDVMMALNEREVNILLINTIAYGDTLGDAKDIQIRENMNYNEFINTTSEVSIELENLKKITSLAVKVIFCRGTLSPSIQSYCYTSNILLVNVADYETLYQISLSTNSEICFGLRSDISNNDIKKVQLSFIPLISTDKLIKHGAKGCSSTVLGYILIHNNGNIHDETELFYTTLIYGRSPDLQNLKIEMFRDGLKRVEYFMKSKLCFLTKRPPERVLLQIFKNPREYKQEYRYEIPVWLWNDIELFRDLVTQNMLYVFESFCKIENYLDMEKCVCIDNAVYKTSVWKESLYCVHRICSSIKFDDNF